MYKKVDTNLNFVAREEELIEFWKNNQVFEKTLEKTKNGGEFSFYDGPPTANGKPHIGHIITRVMKDIIPRYKTMKGFHVARKAGWDTHGLPVELETEKKLGINGKDQIEKYGIQPFTKHCKDSVFKYVSDWRRMSERVGYWVDMDNPYVTYHDDYIESVWWSLKTIFDRGLIYKGHKIVPYCPRCGTALSSHEVAQGYKDVEEQTIIVKFAVPERSNTFILAWTTTPWTLPSNVALCMHPDHDYCLIESGGTNYILAKELAPKHFEDYRILETRKGRDWEGLKYTPLFDFYKNEKKAAHYVVCDTYVTLTDGTGVVHIAPAFGEDDANVGRRYDLPFVQPVGEDGKFLPVAGKLAGIFVKDADKIIIGELKDRGLVFSTLDISHSYPFCWRCDTPLLYYARSTWFIRMTEVRDRLLKNNAMVNWMPESIGKGRMSNFLENVVDWGLSRERYWGTPLPLWVCECGHIHAIGSKEELKTLGKIRGDIELHKPFVDKITIKCDKCGKKMHRTSEVIDCWYDSGAMPFAQHHYPFENQLEFERRFPADFISEAVDQTRGWFYTLLAISTLLFDKPAFKNCIVLGHVNDKNGQKMSKHKGNVVDPWTVLDKQGADAVRWYFYTSSAPWLPSRFSEDAVVEAQRKFLGTLWNTYSFYILYAEIDGFDPTKYTLEDCELSTMDRWLLSGLNTLIKNVDENLERYKTFESARDISDFTDSLSNWYVRRCRERYWGEGLGPDKIAAYMTLYTALRDLSLICAPFIPFMSESIYQNIVLSVDKNAPISVHLCDFPSFDEKRIDKSLEAGMELAIKASALGRAARNQANVKVRQPLSRLLIACNQKPQEDLLEIIRGELNVKNVEFTEGAEEYFCYDVKPQLKTLGPKFGGKINAIREALKSQAAAVVDAVKRGKHALDIGGEKLDIGADDVLVSVGSKEGFSAQSDGGVTVVLDTALSEELIAEGLMREVVSRVQNLRKDSGLEVTDHIVLTYFTDDKELKKVMKDNKASIAKDVLADQIAEAKNAQKLSETAVINGKNLHLSILKSEGKR